jgi:hypothetical protein
MKIHIENDTQERIPPQHVMTRMTQALSRMQTSATARLAKRLLGAALLVAAFPLYALAQATPPTSDLELKAKKKATVVAPKPASGQAAKDAEAVKGTTEGRRRVDEAVKRPPPSRPDGDLTGGIQSKGIQRELTK